jgi:hypothetical protein
LIRKFPLLIRTALEMPLRKLLGVRSVSVSLIDFRALPLAARISKLQGLELLEEMVFFPPYLQHVAELEGNLPALSPLLRL